MFLTNFPKGTVDDDHEEDKDDTAVCVDGDNNQY